ncbi:MFS transporter [Lachnoclostridium sp. Marseille-P6806]|uniref:MFS transporter n=1 Tax=Lachnoclostridium sp. Marseille-P6806 TaxID=2364793 RepID=UPI001031B4DC|nr:MFS transporter [Lachnoclostridium sp. Marseille-P6806]
MIGCTLAAVGGLLNWIAKDNLILLAAGAVITGMRYLPISYLLGLFIIECADYNEWQNRPRMEDTVSSVTSLAGKIGSAFGTFILGIMLNAAHFDGMATVQISSALRMIRFLYGPAITVFYLFILFTLSFYKLDIKKNQISEDLAARHAAKELATARTSANS